MVLSFLQLVSPSFSERKICRLADLNLEMTIFKLNLATKIALLFHCDFSYKTESFPLE